MEKGILFNTEMVRAILEGRKTQTRRMIKLPRHIEAQGNGLYTLFTDGDAYENQHFEQITEYIKPPCQVGDNIYVRETWDWKCTQDYDFTIQDFMKHGGEVVYKADGKAPFDKWIPSIHMPKEAARIWLKVTDVRVERLQDITEEDAVKEGAKAYGPNNCSGTSARIAFAELWDGVYDNWNENPYVWVIEFERINPELLGVGE